MQVESQGQNLCLIKPEVQVPLLRVLQLSYGEQNIILIEDQNGVDTADEAKQEGIEKEIYCIRYFEQIKDWESRIHSYRTQLRP
ncbi:hypothetical protein GCK32_014652 [Trichostrongylus colubriformis]|uniref:Uncharacterized protein n=1 Tax=Trichostrongylus colubriformis TaxID=6319 RepID=A0AAN8J229_TRICO